jgi:endonuclease/exonuclease/phosphatase family metal-dependent hydrolase
MSENAAMVLFLLAALLMPASDPASLRIATFNIRLGTAKDGDNHWEKRREIFFATVKKMDADVIGFQEVLAFQFDEIRAAMPGYELIGAGRNDGKRDGEFVPIAFKTDRFERIDFGHLWLSPTPETPGVRGWDAQLPRMATWARLKEKLTGKTLLFVNTHFDHIGKQARIESAKLLRERLKNWSGAGPAILVGDFNARETDEPYRQLVSENAGGIQLVDAFRLAHLKRGSDEGTFHGFTGERTRERIDWILCTPDFSTVSCEVVHHAENNRYPSDHFPVIAVLKYGSAKQ